MEIFGDYHTHTYFSDGKGSIEDNIKSAISKGLKEVAITDHGFKHMAHGISKKDFQLQMRQIEALKEKYPEIKIYHTVEANLMGKSGRLDLDAEDLSRIDFIQFGFHWTGVADTLGDFWNNKVMAKIFKPSKSRIERNTLAYLNCMDKYPLSFINHLNYGLQVDIRPIAKKSVETNTLIELNGKRVFFSQEEVDIMLEENVKFIMNSDAHLPEHVGDFSIPMNFAKACNLPLERVVNLNEIPKLKFLK